MAEGDAVSTSRRLQRPERAGLVRIAVVVATQVEPDADAEAARQVRRRLADMVIKHGLLIVGHHLNGSAISRLNVRGKGHESSPL